MATTCPRAWSALTRRSFCSGADNRVDQHDAENDGRVHPFADACGDDGGRQQQVDERLMELQGKAHPLALAPARGETVWAVLVVAAARLGVGESGAQIHFQKPRDLTAGS
jgi:hypothetical protein